jgi:TolB protein
VTALATGCGDGGTPPDSTPTTQIVFQSTRLTGTAGIFLMDPDGSNVRPVLADDAINASPVLSPDGTRIAFTSTRAGKQAIYVVDVDGTDLRRITSDTFAEGNPTWSPDGSKIAFVRSSQTSEGSGLFTVNVDGTGLALVRTSGGQPAWSPDGSRIAFADGGIHLIDPDGSALTPLVTGMGSMGDPAWSPDGTKIAFGGVTNNQEIFVVNADGSNVVNVTNTADPLGEIQPVWSPDGTEILFTGFRNGNEEIVRRRADGTGEVVLTNLGAHDLHPSWSVKP